MYLSEYEGEMGIVKMCAGEGLNIDYMFLFKLNGHRDKCVHCTPLCLVP